MAEFPYPVTGHDRVAIDLDGTLAEAQWPNHEIGPPLPWAEKLIRHYSDLGFGIVIYTARPGSHKDMIWQWLTENDLDWMVWDVVCDKPIAGLYIDDMAVNIKELV